MRSQIANVFFNILMAYFDSLTRAPLTLHGSCEFSSEILLIHLAKLESKAVSVGLKIPEPIRFLFVVSKQGSSCSKQPLKGHEKD